MRQRLYTMTVVVAALAILAVPTTALSQAPARGGTQPNPAAEHLAAARTALNKVLNAPAPAGEAFKRLTQLKSEYIALERAASTASPEWMTHYTTIEQLVSDLIGPATAAAEPGAVATSGRGMSLDAAIAADLQEFRTHLTAFSRAMSAVAPAAPSAAPAATPPPAAATTTAPATPPAATTQTTPPDATPPATTTTPPPGTATPPASTTASSAQINSTAMLDQLNTVTALVDGLLAKANATGATIAVDRATLEQIRAQLEQMKMRVKNP